MQENSSSRHRIRFSLRQLLIVVTLAALACCWFVWPRQGERWESLDSTWDDQNSPFHIQFQRRGLELIAVPMRPDGASDLTTRRIIWSDGDTVWHADLIDDRPVRINGEWPLKVLVATYRHDDEDSIEAIAVCADGTIEKPQACSGAIFDENDERFDTAEKLYRFFSQRL